MEVAVTDQIIPRNRCSVLVATPHGKKGNIFPVEPLINTHTHTYIYIYMCVCVFIYIYIYMYTYVYTCRYIHIHTPLFPLLTTSKFFCWPRIQRSRYGLADPSRGRNCFPNACPYYTRYGGVPKLWVPF